MILCKEPHLGLFALWGCMDKISIAGMIRKLFQQDPNRRILGSQLATLLRTEGYSSDTHGRLIDLIRDQVPEVARIERSGMDWFYGLVVVRSESTQIAQSGAQQEWNRDIWRAFASPGAPVRLFVNSNQETVSIVPPNAVEPTPPWVQLPSVTRQQFQVIAQNWAETAIGIEEGHRHRLIDSIAEGVGPQSRFLMEVQLVRKESDWENHRKEGVLKLLEDALSDLGFQQAQDPVKAIRRVLSVGSTAPQRIKGGSLRDLLLRAIQRMPEQDLEKLSVPAGYLYKALRGE